MVYKECGVLVLASKRSPDIADVGKDDVDLGVDNKRIMVEYTRVLLAKSSVKPS